MAFQPIDRDTDYLLPPSVQDWLPKAHLARYVVDVVEGLDLSALERAYAGKGSDAYHPATLLSLLIYGYATGTFSSRKIERATYDSLAFRYIACNRHPDHDTLATFRTRFGKEFESAFVQVLQVARENQLSRFGTVSLDGTKIHANASRHSALSYGHCEKIEAHLKAEVQELLVLAAAADPRTKSILLDLESPGGEAVGAFRRDIQLVFQDAFSAVNPRKTVREIVSEPLRHLLCLSREARARRVEEMLLAVDLAPSLLDKRPAQLSGGQLQRVCLARALAVRPQLLILDEAVSNLDLLLQAEIIALLKRLQAQFDTACLFITHDLRLVERFCQRVLVMEHGRIVETATVSLPLRLRSPAGQALQQAVLPPFPATLLNEAMPCSA